jgi:hypothetical protein
MYFILGGGHTKCLSPLGTACFSRGAPEIVLKGCTKVIPPTEIVQAKTTKTPGFMPLSGSSEETQRKSRGNLGGGRGNEAEVLTLKRGKTRAKRGRKRKKNPDLARISSCFKFGF